MTQLTWTVPPLTDFLGKAVARVYDNHEKEAVPSFRGGSRMCGHVGLAESDHECTVRPTPAVHGR